MRRIAMASRPARGDGARRLRRRRRHASRRRRPGQRGATAASRTPVTITLWIGFSNRELGVVKQAVDAFHQSHPWITVKIVGGVNDDKIIAAIRGGNAPDVAQSFTADNTGLFCSSGGWIDLKPYMDADKIDASMFPQAGADLHAVQGQALRAADAGRHLRPVLQQGPLQEGRDRRAAEDDVRAHGGRQEAHRRPTATASRSSATTRPRASTRTPRRTTGPCSARSGSTAATSRSSPQQPGWAEFMTWQKGLIDFYGYDKLRRWQAGAGEEFSASNAFERGKLAMAIDGEYRTAFIKAEHPDLNYGTAPLPAADSQPELYGAGLRHRQHRRDPQGRQAQGRGVGACEVPGDRRACAGAAVQRPAQRADHDRLAEVQRADARPEVQGVPRHLRPPEDRHDADHGGGQRQPGAVPELRRQVAGGQGVRPAGRRWPRSTSRSTRSSPSRRARRCLAVSATPLAPGGPAPRLQARDRRAARRKAGVAAARGSCSALMSPWIVGFTVFFGYPLLASVYLSFTHYDLISRPRWVGTANYAFMLHHDPQIWNAVQEHAVADGLRRAAAGASSPSAWRAWSCARRPASASSARSSTCPRSRRRWRRRWASPTSSTRRPGPVNTLLELVRDHRAAVVRVARVVEALARAARAVGHRQRDDHLPGGAARRPAPPLRVGRSSTAPAACSGCAG